tara:strand:- start:210 stop:719 length:510 start_codon:yes stop_codon:yes gene_type:complete
MKKLLLILLCLPLLFSSCKKEEGCTDPIATNYNSDAESDDGSCVYSIIGIWTPTSVTIHVYEEEFTPTGQFLYSYDTTATITPEQYGISGNIEFTNESNVIITSSNGNIETGNYTISTNTLTIIDSDGDSNTIFTYIVSKTNLSLKMSITEVDGTTTYTREETIYFIKQ